MTEAVAEIHREEKTMTRINLLRNLLVIGCVLVAAPLAAQESAIVEVNAGDHDRANIPVSLTLPAAYAKAPSLVMQRMDTTQNVVVQRSAVDPREVTWMVTDRIARGQTRRYRLFASNFPQRPTETVTCRDTGKALELAVSGRPVLTYHTATVMPPPDIAEVFKRSGFLHPVRTPSGRVVTADFPADHAHQHGIFFAWKQAEFEGRPIDFWNQADKTGSVEHVAVNQTQSGAVFAEFDVSLRHLDISAPQGPKPVLEETWTVRLYPLRDVFVFDLISRQTCASASPLRLLEYHYGGMGYRGPVAWLGESSGFAMTTSEGLDQKSGNHSRPRWVDCTGPLDGQPCGLRVIQHPANFRYPQPVRLHPSKPYFVFAPEVLGEFLIEPEQVYESRYRFVTFDGAPPATVDQLALAVTDPPVVRIVE
jgi:hypothetical protein